MKKLKLTKVIASSLAVASILALNPIGASAEWKQNSTGWWYTDSNSWATGWRNINGSWYYFYSDGYMAHDTTIEGYKLDSNGAWIIIQPTASTTTTNSKTSNDSNFTFDASTGTIKKYRGTDTTVVISNIVNGVLVKTIGSEAFAKCQMTSVTIPNSVTSISKNAFTKSEGELVEFHVDSQNTKQLLINNRIDESKIILNNK